MNANAKAARDALLAGGPSGAISMILSTDFHVPALTALGAGLVAAWMLPRAYRVLRARWPWLAEFDPGTPA